MSLRAALAVVCLAAIGTASGLEGLTPLEQRGRGIFRTGLGGGPPIIARLGATGTTLPASSLVCADCHGRAGRGSLEGGVVAPDIRWHVLSQPARQIGPNGRERPAYNLVTLRRAIAQGVDANERRLHVAMPNYQLADDDFAALTAYLQSLSAPNETSVRNDAVRLGLAIPSRGPAQPFGAVLRRTLERELTGPTAPRINGRAIELHVIDSAADGGIAALTDATEAASPLAIVAPLFESTTAAQDAERVWSELGALVIGPLRGNERPVATNGVVFELVPSRFEQLRVVQRTARDEGAPVTVWAQRGAWIAAWRDVEASEPTNARWKVVELDPAAGDLDELVARQRSLAPQVLVLLADPSILSAVLPAMHRANWRPTTVTVSSALDQRALAPASSLPPLIVISPGPERATDIGRREASVAACRTDGFVGAQAPACLFAKDAAAVTLEALRRAGRELSAVSLSLALLSLQRFAVPSGQNITFSANRRDGAREVHSTRSLATLARAPKEAIAAGR